MKNKYYTMINGQEVLVRQSTHDNYNYASLECNTFAATKEQVMSRIKRDLFNWYNHEKKEFEVRGFVKIWDWENNCELKLTREQSKVHLTEKYNQLNEKYNNLVSKIVKVYIKEEE